MSIFGKIFSKIFPSANAADVNATKPPAPNASGPSIAPTGTPPPAPGASTTAAPPPSVPLGDVAPILDGMPGASGLNWRTSIVDLMKLLDMDSSMSARKELAEELNYSGKDEPGSASWNLWLHKQVMTRIAANGGTLPAELRD